MNFPVLEMFASVQGEGMHTGVPSIFIRVCGCNLRCVFGNSRCDTPYSSFELETPQWTNVDDLVEAFKSLSNSCPNIKHVVITGGEPMLYKEQIKHLITKLENGVGDFLYTIETNGTLPSLDYWEDDDFFYYIDTWSISPKLSTSVDKNCKFLNEKQRDLHDKTRINIDNLASYIISCQKVNMKSLYEQGPDKVSDYQLKFVYSGEDSVNEILDIIKQIKQKYPSIENINDHIMLMPEGTTNDQLENIQLHCVEACMKYGWRFCDRLHIRLWGDKRGV